MATITLSDVGLTEPSNSQVLTVATLTLTTSSGGALEAEIVVTVTATESSDDDFTQATPFMATFSVGATNNSTVYVTLLILNDDFVEGPERFDLSITNVTSTQMATATSTDATTVTISDNDSEYGF